LIRTLRAASLGTALLGAALVVSIHGCGDRATPAGDPLVVTTETGAVRGVAGEGTRRFLGIPYAAPPVGALRWRPPQPAVPWDGVRDAGTLGTTCPQTIPGLNAVVGDDEDCLTINVVTPDPAPRRAPVMVWLHGGGFTSRDSLFARVTLGDRLAAEEGVVVVSLHYRLGQLGFLAHPALSAEDPAHPASGNYGIEDQRAALEWVKRNIAAFGGDPENVTLFGQSAGGWSTCVHLASAASRGLFGRALVQSGVCTLPLPDLAAAEAQGERVAAAVGCGDTADVAACLRAVPPATLLHALPPDPSIFLMEGDYGLWRPVVDGVVLDAQVADVLARGDAAPVPLLIGANADEGAFFVLAAHEYNDAPLDAANYVDRLRVAFGAERASRVAAQYPRSAYASPADALAAAVGDGLVACPTYAAARLVDPSRDVFVYRFESRAVPYTIGTPALLDPGAFHSAEIPLVFGVPDGPPFSAELDELSATMRHAWASFARNGDPDPDGTLGWPRFAPDDERYLALDDPVRVRPGPLADACAFWRDLGTERPRGEQQ
jgi:para-nitrobenzyl esterase